MNRPEKSFSLFALLLPFAVSILVLCITAGYLIYRIADERAYRERWKDYHDCGLGCRPYEDRFRLSKQQNAGQAGKNQNKRYAQEALMHGVFSKPQNRQKPSVPTGFYTDRP